jgi:hypothetical protein
MEFTEKNPTFAFRPHQDFYVITTEGQAGWIAYTHCINRQTAHGIVPNDCRPKRSTQMLIKDE